MLQPDQTGTVTQLEHLHEKPWKCIKMTKPKLVDHRVERVLIPSQHTKVNPLVRSRRDLS